MAKPIYLCLFSPVTLLAALCTDRGIDFKYVCKRDNVEVFQNLISTSLEREITLYKQFGNNSETIAVWVMQNDSNRNIIKGKYEQKVSFENGTIFLQDFQTSDEAKYVLLYHESSRRKSVELCELVPPTLRCKPNIKHEDNFLIASLDDHESCGKPLVSVRWMDYPGVYYISKSRIKLQPGNQAGTYGACIEGESLNCVKHSSEQENCEYITIGSRIENTSPTISDVPQLTKTMHAVVAIVSLVLFGVLAILLKLFWKHFGIRRKNVSSVDGTRTNRAPSTTTENAPDTEPVPNNPVRVHAAPAIEIEMQPMLDANH